jgi:hypothetical protein
VVKIYNDYKDRADFLTVYVREAHPTDEWQMKSNVKEDVCYAQPKTLEQRVAIAQDFVQRQKYPLPFGIDDMNNAADLAYSAWPERLYVIDEHGHIAYAGGMGPFNYDPEEVRAWLTKRFGPVTQTSSTASSAAVGTEKATSPAIAPAAGSAAAGTPGTAAAVPAPAPKGAGMR